MQGTRSALGACLAALWLTGCGSGSSSTSKTVSITTQPSSVTVAVGGTANFAVVASGSGLSYQWYKGGAALAGATSATLTLSSVAASDAGTYYVVVTSAGGSVTSNSVTLTIGSASSSGVTITGQPSSVTVPLGGTATFLVVASGSSLSYQWYHAGTAIVGATSAMLTLASVTANDAGSYYAVVSGASGSVTSSSATLTIGSANTSGISITTQPTSTTVALGGTATFTVVASGTGLTYQWYKGGTILPRGTAATLTLSAVTAADAGTYYVVVANTSGSVTSNSVTLSIGSTNGATVSITTQPTATVVTVGSKATLSVVASGSSLSYQWYKGGTAISGATSASYTVSSMATSNIGAYYVTVSSGSTTVTSDTVTLYAKTSLGIWGAYEQSGGDQSQSGATLRATDANQSAVWLTDSARLTLTNPTVTTSGNTSSQDNSSFYGLNAGLLASAGTLTVSGGTVTTTGTGANGVFSTGSGAAVTLSNLTINCSADGAHAVMATQGATMTLTNVNMTTAGASSGAIATDRGGGTINVTGGTVTTSGMNSPGIYSTGAITVSGATIRATGAEAAVIEGSNSITLSDTTISGQLKRGVMLYQSMSGDASGSNSTFTMTGGTLAAAAGPLFYVTNATGNINLNGVGLTASSGTLVQAAAGDWGTTGSNGGQAVLKATGQTMVGNLVSDSISSIAATLSNSSTLTGWINTAGLTLDKTSSWQVTADSVLTWLSDAAGISGTSITNIYGNGHTVTYDSSLSANSALGAKTYTLAGGGTLKPK